MEFGILLGMRHLPLFLALIGCAGGSDEPAPDETGNPPDTDTGTDTGADTGTDTGTDTGDTGDTEPAEWLVLPANCTPPADLPSDPIQLTGQIQITQTTPGGYFMELLDLEPDGDTIYGVGQGGLLAFDISDPTAPTELGHFVGPANRFHRVEKLSATQVAVTHRDVGLVIVDASDPTSMSAVSRIDASGWEGLAVSGETIFVTESGVGLVVLDASDPSAPVEVTTATGLAAPWSLSEIVDGWMFAADNTLGIVPIDVTDPTAPVIYDGVLVADAAVLDVTWDGTTAYVSAGGAGVVVFDVSTPAVPVEIGRLKLGGSAVMTALSGDTLFVVDHDGISAVDVSDPASPRWIGEQFTPQFALAVASVGGRAWVGDWSILSGWDVEPSAGAGELVLAEHRITLPEEGGIRDVTISNHGGGELVLTGAETLSPDDVALAFSTDRLASGESATLRITYTPSGTGLVSELCIASSDPDGPRRPLGLHSGVDKPPLGEPAPDFTLEDLDGTSHRLSEQLGSPVLLAYFATW